MTSGIYGPAVCMWAMRPAPRLRSYPGRACTAKLKAGRFASRGQEAHAVQHFHNTRHAITALRLLQWVSMRFHHEERAEITHAVSSCDGSSRGFAGDAGVEDALALSCTGTMLLTS